MDEQHLWPETSWSSNFSFLFLHFSLSDMWDGSHLLLIRADPAAVILKVEHIVFLLDREAPKPQPTKLPISLFSFFSAEALGSSAWCQHDNGPDPFEVPETMPSCILHPPFFLWDSGFQNPWHKGELSSPPGGGLSSFIPLASLDRKQWEGIEGEGVDGKNQNYSYFTDGTIEAYKDKVTFRSFAFCILL